VTTHASFEFQSRPAARLLSRLVLSATLACAVLAASARSAQAAEAKAPTDFSGFWEISAGAWTQPRTAKLTPIALAHDKHADEERAAGKVVAYGSRWCHMMGVPFIMGQSPPINIAQADDEMLIMAEQVSAARHIYLDGRSHPSAATFAPTTNGHSIGHWQGGELVVDTTNFSSRGANDIPGGGYRTRTSHQVEDFKLSDDGKTLTIVSTWDDPSVFVEPHTYTSTYHKLPASTYAFEDICDASDAAPFEHSGGIGDAPADE